MLWREQVNDFQNKTAVKNWRQRHTVENRNATNIAACEFTFFPM